MRVCDVMTPNPITIDPQAPVGTAVAVMRERRLRHLPVVDDRGRLIGIVTDRDLRALTADLDDVRVNHVMTSGPLTTGPQALLAQAAAVMVDARVGSLLVVDGQRLVGILTERDVLRALAATLPSIKGADPDQCLR